MIVNRLKNPFVQQYVLEILFPIIGYLFFDWDFFIIGIYFLLDFFCDQILFARRAYWVMKKGSAKKSNFTLLLLNSLCGLIFIFLFAWGFFTFSELYGGWTSAEVQNKFIDFAKSELWILFPVLLYLNHFTDQFKFYAPRRYLKLKFNNYIYVNLLKQVIIILLLFLLTYAATIILIHQIVLILIYLIGKILIDIFIWPIINKHMFV